MQLRTPVFASVLLFGAASSVTGCRHGAPPPRVLAAENIAPLEAQVAPEPGFVAPPSLESTPSAPESPPVVAVPTLPVLDRMAAAFDELSAAREVWRVRTVTPAPDPTLDAGLACVGNDECEQGWTAHGFDAAHQRWFTLSEMPSDDRDEPTPAMLELTTTDATGARVLRVTENPRGAARIRRALGSVPRTEVFVPLRGTSVEGTYEYFDGYAWQSDAFSWVLALEGPFAGWALWAAPNVGDGFVIHLSRIDRGDDRVLAERGGREDACSGGLVYVETDEPVPPPENPSNTTGFDGYHACWPPRLFTVLLAPDHRSLLIEGYRSEPPEAPTSEAIHIRVALPPDLVPAP